MLKEALEAVLSSPIALELKVAHLRSAVSVCVSSWQAVQACCCLTLLDSWR